MLIASLLLLSPATGQAQTGDTPQRAPLALKLADEVAPIPHVPYAGTSHASPAKPHRIRSNQLGDIVPRLLLCSSALMVGALAGADDASVKRPLYIALGTGAVTFAGLGAWAAADGADTGVGA